jgi:uncharacterized protein
MGKRVAISKLDYSGRELISYAGELVSESADEFVVRCEWARLPAVTVGFLTFTAGDILLEHFYRAQWFNIFELYSSCGQLRGWYCNLAEPVVLTDSIIRWRDCALDLLVSPNGELMLEDEDEFEALQPGVELRAAAGAMIATLQRWVTDGHPPFIRNGLKMTPLSGAL